MSFIWKLIYRHVSLSQMCGFLGANFCGLFIVLLSIQFYQDIAPAFSGGDSFIKKDFLIVTKKVSTLGSFVGKSMTFSDSDIKEIEDQPFTKGVGLFTPSQYQVSAGVNWDDLGLNLSTAMFFESVPDRYIDVSLDDWSFEPGQGIIPIIIPQNYLNMYNLGFAQSRNLPQISEGILHMINVEVRIGGGGRRDRYKGNIVGFSNRLNTILVPESFMVWANTHYADMNSQKEPSRLIVEVDNPTDTRITQFFKERGYEIEDDKLDAGKTMWFLKILVGVVLSVGLLISCLSFYILMLSIYLLLQKNVRKLENLLLIGYAPNKIALPYQMLAIGLNAIVFFFSVVLVFYLRSLYSETLGKLLPAYSEGSSWWMVSIGVLIFLFVSLLNGWMIRKKVNSIWRH